jgi:hypothetical protein
MEKHEYATTRSGVTEMPSHAPNALWLVCTGTEETESDIDLMVLLEGPVQAAREIRRIWEVLYPLQLESARLLSITTVDAALYDQGAYALYRQAKAEGVAL